MTKKNLFSLSMVVALVLMLFSGSALSQNIPDKPRTLVSDFAGIMSAEQNTNLETKLRNYEKQTSIEIAVVTVKTLDGVEIDEYANQLFRKWGIGKKETNNGLLILIAPTERKWRMEVGYGLEGYFTDVGTKDIGERNFKPNFKAGKFYEGIDAGLNDLIKLMSPDAQTLKEEYQKEKKEKQSSSSTWIIIFVVVVIIIIIIAILASVFSGFGGGSGSSGGFFGSFGGSDSGSSGGGFGGFGGGDSGGGGSSGGW